MQTELCWDTGAEDRGNPGSIKSWELVKILGKTSNLKLMLSNLRMPRGKTRLDLYLDLGVNREVCVCVCVCVHAHTHICYTCYKFGVGK